ncbi:hypothetical protein TWF730_010025 [Orbilia blumenaviensis]|uniref:C2H2-type domain-containing protein n=1 Tax=Orbilia blumenaviensis TaxID=1796055 RepID=A0AAV9UTH1_9PEZI
MNALLPNHGNIGLALENSVSIPGLMLDEDSFFDFAKALEPANLNEAQQLHLPHQDDSNNPGVMDTPISSLTAFFDSSLPSQISSQECPYSAPANPQTTFVTAMSTPQGATTPISSGEDGVLKRANRRKRRRIHTAYNCPECSEKVSSLRVLGDHIRDVHKMKGFKCGNCETRVSRYDNLMSHQRACKPAPHVAPNGVLPTREGRPRVCVRDINLQPELIRSLPRPTQGTPPTEPRPTTLALSEVEGMNLHPAPPPPTRIPRTNEASSGSGENRGNAASNPMLEIEDMRTKLEELKFEVSHWKEQYISLRRICKCCK